jgi:hypothetical protein
MADPRARVAVKLVDPTTNANEAGVTAAGELKVSLTASSATVTVDTELSAAAALADNTSNPTVTSVGNFNHTFDGTNWDRQRSVIAAQDTVGDGVAAAGILGQLDDVSTAAVTENQFAPLRISTRRALLVEGVASGTNLNVNLAASAATVTVDSELPAAGALADNTSNPTVPGVGAYLMAYDGTDWDRVRLSASLGSLNTAVTNTVTVDSELPAAAALADNTANPTVPAVGSFLMGWDTTNSNWDRVALGNNTGRLQVDIVSGGGADAPTSPKTTRATSSAVAAGSSATLQSTQITSGKTAKLERVICSAAVPLKVDLQTVLNGTGTTVATWFVLENTAFTFETRHRNYISQAESATAGFDGFQCVVTNNDNNTAGDVYAFFAYDEQ